MLILQNHSLGLFINFASPPLYFRQNNDELSVQRFALAGVNSAILSAHKLFETCRLRMHPNKSFLIEV